MKRRSGRSTGFTLALALMGAVAAVGVSGASAADFEGDNGPCRETPGEAQLLRCPTGIVGKEYEVEIESEEGSGCSPDYDYFVIVNSTLPPGLTMSRDGVISGVPTTTGLTRFWIHNHDLVFGQGGPSWCTRDDVSEREFSIFVDPGLEIENERVKGADLGETYSETFTATSVETLNPQSGSEVEATWALESGTLPAGFALSPEGSLTGTPTAEGSYSFVVRAVRGNASAAEQFTLSVRRAVAVQSPLGSTRGPSAEVGLPFTKTVTATGGSGNFTWSTASGTLPQGMSLNPETGAIAGTPLIAGSFAFVVAATDDEGRAATANLALNVAPRLAVKTVRLTPASVGRAYRARVATTGGVTPVTWKLTGKLPPGVRFEKSTGNLAGTPRRVGRFTVVVQVRDALGAKARRRLTLRVIQ